MGRKEASDGWGDSTCTRLLRHHRRRRSMTPFRADTLFGHVQQENKIKVLKQRQCTTNNGCVNAKRSVDKGRVFRFVIVPLNYTETNIKSENAHSVVPVNREKKLSICIAQKKNGWCTVAQRGKNKPRNNLERQEIREQIRISFIKKPTTFKKIDQH